MKRQLSPIWQIFPSPIIAGFYSPLGQYIQLNKISGEKLEEIKAAPTFQHLEENSLINHELRHWADHNLTLWGLKNNIDIFNAYSGRLSFDEQKFFRVKQLTDTFKKDSLLTYYTEHYNKLTGSLSNPWRYELTCGVRFNDAGFPDNTKPIVFVKFSTSNGLKVCRVPLSVRSLLETKAIYEEFLIKNSAIQGIEDIVESHLQKAKFKSDLESWLYNPDYVEYSVAAHFTSTALRITDVTKAFEVSSQVATIALNLPPKLVKALPIPEHLAPWGQRSQELLNINDEGFIFFLLIQNYKSNYTGNFDINNLLASSGLPEINVLTNEVLEESYQLISKVDQGIFYPLAIDKIGFFQTVIPEVSLHFELDKLLAIEWMDRHLPPIMCSDTDFELIEAENFSGIFHRISLGQKISFQEFYSVFSWCEYKFEEFVAICGA